ncbi:exo-beta-N-acetylmuramidase NamZ family protein [Sediminitomix flava]|uniref:Uncharacterized protein YbbC (DUF1343 family) n=1 Tax=Sediminitomix flava TaxID=379075 RepID=A0A315ZGI7_SEDFL|nr:DUF1343 domain-containing protein [Sediminitomix flava]PWJ44452.1 uncharacterized protein YbbC (DUF1343 family) [Sediminitomix flava]
MYTKLLFVLSLFSFLGWACQEQTKNRATVEVTDERESEIICGADQLDVYLPSLEGKKVALVVNHTSVVDGTHLVDTLLSRGVKIKTIFAPEHGFRGKADAGAKVNDSLDPETGLPIISLYGKLKKPSIEMLKDIDLVIFDIQDVGVRFYTYISTMYYVMEACAEQGKKLLILDRPNPLGDYTAGPILNPDFKSFVGIVPIPVVHGLTVGELAQMINGENWMETEAKCDLEVVKVQNYDHQKQYILPIKPSPNLPNHQSIRLYPSLCFFEPTVVSIGRGTNFPFQVIGYPDENLGDFSFTPIPIKGASMYPKLQDKKCYGLDLRNSGDAKFTLSYFMDWYQKMDSLGHEKFIDRPKFMDLLAGTDVLRKQIESGTSLKEIEDSWTSDLAAYNQMREKYLLYPN